jgi:ubiquinone biosynthesis protein COQ4
MKSAVTLLKVTKSIVTLVKNPSRLDQVFALFDNVRNPAILQTIVDHVARDERGARALEERRRLEKIDLATLSAMDEGTLGKTFAEHMIRNGLDPASIPTLAAKDRGEFLRAHLYETHDIWHVVTGFGTDVSSEIGLQAFYLAQFPGRLAAGLVAGGLVNMIFFAFDERDQRMRAITRGWLLGKRSKPLFGVRWEEMWTKPLEDVRRELGVDADAIESELPS